jgi:anti-sigma regulatory factor (Ser/Thr protein kinase)
MARRPDSGEVNMFLLREAASHPRDLVAVCAQKFKISPEAVRRRLRALASAGWIEVTGETRDRTYAPKWKLTRTQKFPVRPGLAEDVVWRQHVLQLLADLPDNVRRICHYGFTEIFNNAIDHAHANVIKVDIWENPATIRILVRDDGVGIFRKIKEALHLNDEREAILELSKGKLTTDPQHHSGQGIFFTSRMVDEFSIHSGTLFFAHDHERDDWLIEPGKSSVNGTTVRLEIRKDSKRTTKDVFDDYATVDEPGFHRTHVPLRLASFGGDELVSRSQAKRVLTRCEQFSEVVLDFSGIESIGQGFADEIFRVFASEHPDVKVRYLHANRQVDDMIRHVLAHRSGAKRPTA